MSERRFEDYKKTFYSVREEQKEANNVFSPQKIGNKLKLLAGSDGNKYALSIQCKSQEIKLTSTELIKVKRIELENQDMAILFLLSNDDLLPIFISFAIDLESVIDKDENVSLIEVYNRYLYWRKMFNVEKMKVSESVIKGLLNELYVLEKFLIPKYGVDSAIRGWMGAEGSQKDFAYEDGNWYEAKAINFGKGVVRISSLEQLEATRKGMIVVTELERTSIDNPEGIRIYDQINKLRRIINTENTDLSLLTKLTMLGFTLDLIHDTHNEVNQFRYIIHNTKFYLVDDDFPRITRNEIPNAIGAVSYDLILAEIQDKLIEFM